MNLTKVMKEEIVAQVIRDVPRLHSDNETFQKRVTEIIDAAVADGAPVEVAQMWADQYRLREHLNINSGSIAYMVKVPKGMSTWDIMKTRPFSSCNTSRPYCCNELPKSHAKKLQAVFDECWAEVLSIEEIENKLKSALAGIRTRKQFIAAFPELEKYAPEEVKPSPMLPALTNVVSDLAKLGWPKTVETTAA